MTRPWRVSAWREHGDEHGDVHSDEPCEYGVARLTMVAHHGGRPRLVPCQLSPRGAYTSSLTLDQVDARAQWRLVLMGCSQYLGFRCGDGMKLIRLS